MRLSVVIPTFDRRERLVRTLDALRAQRGDVPGGVEVIVVDDGSTDGTPGLLQEREGAGDVVFLSVAHGGPAGARNAGARAARGAILLFLGDDVAPEPGFLAEHDRAHREPAGPRAVLGYTGWDRTRMRVTPLLRHLNERGLQFGYGLIADSENVPFNFFYTSNVSLPKEVFLALGGFDESFPFAAWEDVEFSWRATRAQPPLHIVYRSAARARHDHPVTLAAFRNRQRRSGLAAAVFFRKHAGSAAFLGVAEAASTSFRRPALVSALGKTIEILDPLGVPLPPSFYDKALRWDYLAGLKEGVERGILSGERDAAAANAEAEALH